MRVLKSFTFRGRGRQTDFPIEQVLDGRIWELNKEDCRGSVTNRRSVLMAAARVRGKRIKTNVTAKGTLVVQANPA